jgi:hypothetical protein
MLTISLRLVVMAANCAGISGSQIFRTEDAPRYLNGLTAICVLAGVSWVQASGLSLQYLLRRRKAPKNDDESESSATA